MLGGQGRNHPPTVQSKPWMLRASKSCPPGHAARKWPHEVSIPLHFVPQHGAGLQAVRHLPTLCKDSDARGIRPRHPGPCLWSVRLPGKRGQLAGRSACSRPAHELSCWQAELLTEKGLVSPPQTRARPRGYSLHSRVRTRSGQGEALTLCSLDSAGVLVTMPILQMGKLRLGET